MRWLPALILLMGSLYIFVIPLEPFGIKLLFKLIPMVLIIYYGFRQMPLEKEPTHWLLLIGLFFGMIGDGTLQWFVIGLSAFLICHLFYIAGFLPQYNFSWIRLSFILPLIIFSIFIGSRLISSLQNSGNDFLTIPVVLYVITIMLMAWFAMMTGNKWVIFGSILFVVSDSILAWNMFIEAIRFSGPLVMVPYYSAQFFIAHSLRTIVPKI